jgi:hypothetical protein
MKRALLFFNLLLFPLLFQAQQHLSDCQFLKQNTLLTEARESITASTLASNLRSDTTDILHYTINLNITDFITDTIRGNTSIRFAPRMNAVKTISLDLLHLRIDSVTMASGVCSYSYNDTLLITKLPHTFNNTDTAVLTVYYHGRPRGDASGWGGFYFQSGYAYNLGVGFAANPHCYGRVWYPCFDNFVERATYTFNITTNAGKIAYCNGILTHDTTFTGGICTRTWNLYQTIPSYLACVAVASFTQMNFTFNSLTGPKPVVIAAVATDTANVRSSFIHLPNAFQGFENRYGPYQWDKVGYSLVPFNSGAMEHATNIAYPRAFANGSTLYESGLMAHELSHHWFGDLATCSTEGDMWLNEGWATYSQRIFMENVYGYSAYISQVQSYHDDVLHYANWKEGGYQALSGIPHQYTYGDHVYLKGADVAHTLRSYMGDSLFFTGLKYHLSHSQYKAVSSTDFMNNLIAGTGLGNLNDFFAGWVFNPGWPHFSVDSFQVVPLGGNYIVQVFVKQKLTGAPSYFNQVPLELTFMDSTWISQTKTIVVSGKNSNFTFTLPFRPTYAGLNLGDKVSHAVTENHQFIRSTTPLFSIQYRGRMSVTALNSTIATDSAWIRIEHNYTAPDPFKHGGQAYVLSPNRYWRVDGIFPANFKASATLEYDGRALTTGGYGSLDNNFLFSTDLEDSIVLLYRADRADDWHLDSSTTKNTGVLTDKFGSITINNLRRGEYVLALKGFFTGIRPLVPGKIGTIVYPNPSTERFQIELTNVSSGNEDLVIEVYDILGRQLLHEAVFADRFSIGSENWKDGVYLLTILRNGKPAGRARLVVSR